MGALTALYGVAVPDDAQALTVADFFAEKFNGKPAVGDDIVLEEIALVVDAIEQDRVHRVGLDLNPRRRQAPAVPFLPDRRELAAWWRRTRSRLKDNGGRTIATLGRRAAWMRWRTKSAESSSADKDPSPAPRES